MVGQVGEGMEVVVVVAAAIRVWVEEVTEMVVVKVMCRRP